MIIPPELSSALTGLVMALITALTGCVVALGYAGVQRIRRRSEREEELDRRRSELAQLELDEKIRARTKALALDAASIAQETSLGQREPLTGPQKATYAADKLRELDPSLAQADRSTVSDLVKLGAAQLRSQSHGALPVVPPGSYLISPSNAPPPDVTRPATSPAVAHGWPEERPTLPPVKRPILPKETKR